MRCNLLKVRYSEKQNKIRMLCCWLFNCSDLRNQKQYNDKILNEICFSPHIVHSLSIGLSILAFFVEECVSIWYLSMQKRVWNNKKLNGHTHTSVLTCWIINADLGQQMTTRPMSLFIFCWCHLPQKSLVLTIQFASV